ncbi:MAG: NAD(P)/FAD-dependent oxidoreductase [Rhodothermales bacterium]
MDYDVVVIGSGPAGATAARRAAEGGLRVLLVDKRQELGAPIQCSGAVSAHALSDAAIAPDHEIVVCPIYGFAVYDAAGRQTRLDYRQLKPADYGDRPLGYVVDRRRFDRHCMTLAERAGVTVWLKTEALGYTPGGEAGAEVALRQFGQPRTVRARVVVGADGIMSQVGKWAGMRTDIRLNELASCLQYVVDGVETDGLLEIVTGYDCAPGGYAWVFPKGGGYAEIGLGVIRSVTDVDARTHLERFMQSSFMAERFRNARILEIQGGGVPLAAPLKQPYADNLILVGDAARHVNPITGGGIHTALRGGVIAGAFLADHLAGGGRLDAAGLAGYHERWRAELGDALNRIYAIKRAIFRGRDRAVQDAQLYDALAGYFHPESAFKKV